MHTHTFACVSAKEADSVMKGLVRRLDRSGPGKNDIHRCVHHSLIGSLKSPDLCFLAQQREWYYSILPPPPPPPPPPKPGEKALIRPRSLIGPISKPLSSMHRSLLKIKYRFFGKNCDYRIEVINV